ncbi:hypothetical protein LLE49_20020 [Alicyclobacillus tolerans]|uniref:hypothetical protein n=1 Tax=Alicyclobacillus tolerans TaxID=90970 RepID=UPI001F35A850|nr:hypothetical protein [Alicyclobacillus tolerans]MCF8567011.1 hypothetical protein [Alicyclobacillus tolerans]
MFGLLKLPQWFLGSRTLPGQPNVQPNVSVVPQPQNMLTGFAHVVSTPQQLGWQTFATAVVDTTLHGQTTQINGPVPHGYVIGNGGTPTVRSSNAPSP